MAMEFQHIFAGKRVWAGEIEGDAFVDRFVIAVAKIAQAGSARFRQRAEQSGCDVCDA